MFAAVEFFIHFVKCSEKAQFPLSISLIRVQIVLSRKKKVVFPELGLYVKQHLQLLTPKILASNFEIFQKITHINY